MNKNELVSHVAAETSATKAGGERMVRAVFSTIGDALARDEAVAIDGFGTFFTRTRALRHGRYPRTGESLDIPASTTPAFKASKKLRDTVSGAGERRHRGDRPHRSARGNAALATVPPMPQPYQGRISGTGSMGSRSPSGLSR